MSLKGSCDIAKNNIIWCIWCKAMCLFGLRFKKHIIFHILYIFVAPLWNAYIFTKFIVLRSKACSDWPAIQCIVIGWIPQAWDGNFIHLMLSHFIRAVSRRDNTKTHYKRGICCIQWVIITDYNDLRPVHTGTYFARDIRRRLTPRD